MTLDLKSVNGQSTSDQAELSNLLTELAARTNAVRDTMAANMSDSAYIQALRSVQNTATKVVEQVNRAS
ncbi:MAG: hypothetical protein WBW62_07145 [Solirubrobacterales bacterium]